MDETKPYATLEVGDWVWLGSEVGRYTVTWCNPAYDAIELVEDGNPAHRYHTYRDDIKRAKRPKGKPHTPYTPPPGPPF